MGPRPLRQSARGRLDRPLAWLGRARGCGRAPTPGHRPAGEYVYEFEVTNRAGTYWYHPHSRMRTGAQVYAGLAGVLLVRDAEEDTLSLSSGEAELLCVIQDRRFDALPCGGMMDMMNGFLGDRVLVNGLRQPTTEVDAAWHRDRVVAWWSHVFHG